LCRTQGRNDPNPALHRSMLTYSILGGFDDSSIT
jgi:hypothetical protein